MRMTKVEEAKFNKKLERCLAEYKENVSSLIKPNLSLLIKKYDLTKRGKLITNKAFLKIIGKREDVQSYTEKVKERVCSIVKDFQSGLKKADICEKYDLDSQSFSRIINRSGHGNQQQATLDKHRDVLELYGQGMPIYKVAREVSLSEQMVSAILKKNDKPIRMQSETSILSKGLNCDYFEKIDSKEKAWVLGFIFADGCITKNHLQISQDKESDYILDIVAEQLNYPGGYTDSSKSHTLKRQSVLTISRKKIAEDLRRLGMTFDKENTLAFPYDSVREEFHLAFISGFFNGDGSTTLTIQRNRKTKTNTSSYVVSLNWQITSTQAFCASIANILNKAMGHEFIILKEGQKNAYRVTTKRGKASALDIIQRLDKEGFGIVIENKYDKAVFAQRFTRRIKANDLAREFDEANLFYPNFLAFFKANLAKGFSKSDVANLLEINKHYLNSLLRKAVKLPKKEASIVRMEKALNLPRKDFINWDYLQRKFLLETAWKLKNSDYKYQGIYIDEFGEVTNVLKS